MKTMKVLYKNKIYKGRIAVYACFAMVILLFTILRFYPILKVFYMSLFNWNMATGSTKFIGMVNFENMFSNATFLGALWRTIYIGFAILLISLPVSLLIAVMIYRNFIGKSFVQTALFIPYIRPMVPVVVIWKWLFNTRYGLVNYVLNTFGFDSLPWLTQGNLAEWAIIIITIWKNLGYCVLILTVGMAGISRVYYEAADIDGASWWYTFWHITLPLLKPILVYTSVIMLIRGFNVYTQAYILCSDSSGSPGYIVRVLVYDLMENGFRFFKMGYAAAEAVVLFVIVLILSLVQFTVTNDGFVDRINVFRRNIREKRRSAV